MEEKEKLSKIKQSFQNALTFMEIIDVSGSDLKEATVSSGFTVGVKITNIWTALKEIISVEDKFFNLTPSEEDEIVEYITEKRSIDKEKAEAIVSKLFNIFSEFILLSKLT